MRLLFVHAHPDDETLASGLTMASYARRGHDVHVLTCTLGEEGEVIPPELRYLAADRTDTLGPWRREELRRAMAVLGVRHQVLGEDPATGVLSRYRDSGMAGTASAEHPRAFVRADPDEAAGLVRETVATLRPDVVVTYDRHGGYEHPDHIQTHRVTCAAVRGLADPAGVPALYAILTPRSWAEQDRRWLAEHLGSGSATSAPRLALPDPEGHYPPSVVADEVVTHEVVDPAALDLQVAALREHRTQVTVYDGYFALSNSIAARLPGREGFARIDPRTGDPVPGGAGRGDRRHTGLLAGVA